MQTQEAPDSTVTVLAPDDDVDAPLFMVPPKLVTLPEPSACKRMLLLPSAKMT